jgi:hypothetical protein
MRIRQLVLTFLACCAACTAPQGGKSSATETATANGASGEPAPFTRIVFRQFYAGSQPFVMENLAGRDLIELRSKPIAQGDAPVAYVPDAVMRELLSELRRFDYYDHAGPRPPDPSRFGVGELTVAEGNARPLALIRTRQPPGEATTAYRRQTKCWSNCTRAFIGVYNFHRPSMQATSSTGDFGTKRAR